MMVLPEKVTIAEAGDVLQMFEQNMQHDSGDTLTVDASGLHDFDSAAIAVLLECARQAKAWGKRFDVRAAPPKLTELAQLYGVDDLLTLAR
jgi:phospholipid transport system transporter-binding protein